MVCNMATNRIKKIGNGAFIPVSASQLEQLKLNIGDEIHLSVKDNALVARGVGTSYMKTRKVARRMSARYADALRMLGREEA